MTKKKVVGRPFQKGQSGNPLGGKLGDPNMKKLRALSKAELVEVGNLLVKGDVTALRENARDPKATVLQTMLASVAVKIISKGDMGALNQLLDRLIGKVKDEVHHTGDVIPGSRVTIIELPDNGRRAPKETK